VGALGQANAQVAQAEAAFESAQQDLIVRVATAYFNVLATRDTLASTRASKASTAKQLEQAKRKYHVGLSAITDVQEARAAYDRIIASEIASERSLKNARNALSAIIGRHVTTLAEPGDTTNLKPPTPHNPKAWVDVALKQNPMLIADRFSAKAADKNVGIQAAGHYPSLDLVLQHGKRNQIGELEFLDQAYTRRTDIGENEIMLQLTWPIFSGGATFARTRQAKHQYHAAEDQVELSTRQTVQNTRDTYLGVITGISQVKALKQAVHSSLTSLKATQAGLKVGTRTTIDVLTTRQNLLSAQTNYAQSRYNYLVSTLQLKQAAGILDAADVQRLNRFLNKTVSVNVPPVSTSGAAGGTP
jgi:outer membrane protein